MTAKIKGDNRFGRHSRAGRAGRRATLLCLLALLMSAPVSAKTFRFNYDKELALEPGEALAIQNSVGKVTVVGREGIDRMTVEAVKTVRAADEEAARKIAEYVELRFSTKADRAIIETIIADLSDQRRSFWDRLVGADNDWFVSVDYSIIVPRDVEVFVTATQGEVILSSLRGPMEVSVFSGSLELSDIKGQVVVDATSGLIKLTDIIGDIEVTTTSAEVTVSSLRGDLTVHGGSGDLNADFLTGSVTIVQTSGDITLTELQGDARLKATSGVVTIRQEQGALDVFTHTGRVDVATELFSERAFSVETLSGGISFSIPDNAGANIELSTLSGEIDTRGLPLEVESFSRREISGVIGAGGAPVRLKTDSGDIRLAWR